VTTYSQWGKHRTGISSACVYGGVNKHSQIKTLSYGAHIVVATPGRLLDFIAGKNLSLSRVTYFVLDEADRMLDMGFQGDVASISSQVRPERQVLFFSATWSADVQVLAHGLCEGSCKPVRIHVASDAKDSQGVESTGFHAREGIEQEVVVIDIPDAYEQQVAQKRSHLDSYLCRVLAESPDHKVLVFVNSKEHSDDLSGRLSENGFQADAMHGGRGQEYRLWVLDQFRKGLLRVLVATDVLGRGIDIPHISHVVVFDMGTIEEYVHRIGRTARGVNGQGKALVFFEYYYKMPGIAADLVRMLEDCKQPVPQELKRIVEEVESGKREVFKEKPRRQWGARNWDSNSAK